MQNAQRTSVKQTRCQALQATAHVGFIHSVSTTLEIGWGIMRGLLDKGG